MPLSDAAAIDSANRDASTHDATSAIDAGAGDAATGDAATGDAATGDAPTDDASVASGIDAASAMDAYVALGDAYVALAPDAVVAPADAAFVGPDAGFACPAGMLAVLGGRFLMGDPAPDDAPSQPVHGVALSSFCIDRTEVTVAAYDACAAAGCTAPDTGRACNQGIVGREDHPINCVDWNQARAYCQSLGADLPTEAQWEYAARGSDGRTYPWGNDVPASQLCWSGAGTTRMTTCAVGSFPSGVSPFGLVDMAGNVWEWTLDWYGAYSGDASSYVMDPTGAAAGISHVNRGGAWGNTIEIDVRPMIRFGGRPTRRLESLGFRCARPPL